MERSFDYIAGVGGIGTGILFLLEGNSLLGRNESRSGILTDYKDFCKLHIILHYAARFLEGSVPVYPIGYVGADTYGETLVEMMREAGMDCQYVKKHPAAKTIFSVCFQYPDGQGGNITTSNNASAFITERDIDDFFSDRHPDQTGLILAAPEVPLPIRSYLLRKGREHGCFTTAGFLANEAENFFHGNNLTNTDLLAINQDEADALCSAAMITGENRASRIGLYLVSQYPHLSIVITLGKEGSLYFSSQNSGKVNSLSSDPVSTAGAGDCFLGVILACLALGIPLFDEPAEESVSSAVKFASIAAGIKVTWRDTIHPKLDYPLVRKTIDAHALTLSSNLAEKFDSRGKIHARKKH